MRIWLALVLVSGCALDNRGDRGDDGVTVTPPGGTPPNGNCPSGETCSDQTPNGLLFVGEQPVFLPFPNGLITTINHNIAANGTDDIQIKLGNNMAFTLPFEAKTTSPVSVVSTDGTTITLTETAGQGYLRIVDDSGLLYDREAYASSVVSEFVPVPVNENITVVDGPGIPTGPYAFAVGSKRLVGIAMLDAGPQQHRLIDTSLKLDGGTQTHWDQLQLNAPTAGTYTVTATQNSIAHDVAITVVDKADAIVPLIAKGSIACFAAQADGAYIVGANWHFTINGLDIGAIGGDYGPNCVGDVLATTFTVTATALGKSLTITTTAN